MQRLYENATHYNLGSPVSHPSPHLEGWRALLEVHRGQVHRAPNWGAIPFLSSPQSLRLREAQSRGTVPTPCFSDYPTSLPMVLLYQVQILQMCRVQAGTLDIEGGGRESSVSCLCTPWHQEHLLYPWWTILSLWKLPSDRLSECVFTLDRPGSKFLFCLYLAGWTWASFSCFLNPFPHGSNRNNHRIIMPPHKVAVRI